VNVSLILTSLARQYQTKLSLDKNPSLFCKAVSGEEKRFITRTILNRLCDTQQNDTHYNGIRHYATQYNGIQHNDTQYNGIRHYDTQYNGIQHNDTQYNGIQHNDTQYNGIQHINTQFSGI
jgi:hypothetical protein